jgi:hypothetical protein
MEAAVKKMEAQLERWSLDMKLAATGPASRPG